MAELRRSTDLGELRVHGWQRPVMEAALEEGLELARARERLGGFTRFAGHEVYLKGGPLRGPSRWRHGAAAALLRRPWPRVREYENLSWLIERQFQAALPLAAGVLLRRGLPVYQFLATASLPAAVPLEEHLPGAGPAEAEELLLELARETARMHSLRFVHQDLYPRNLLVLPPGGLRRIVFLDAWAGGPPPTRRSWAHDLGCLFLEAGLLSRDLQRHFLLHYREQRALQERPLPRGWLEAVARERQALRRRLESEPRRLRGRSLPAALWPDPELARSLA